MGDASGPGATGGVAVDETATAVRSAALPLVPLEAARADEAAGSLDPLLERIGEARFVLLGEASHGTAEYHLWRAVLTRRLIEEKGFRFVAVEGDWPDCHAVHRAVTGAPGAPDDPMDALEGFRRWPAWLWANTDVARFARWLRRYNDTLPADLRVGFHGLDVYALWESLHAVLEHLAVHVPEQLEHAGEAMLLCVEPYGRDPRSHARATRLVPERCEPEVLDLLVRLRGRAARREAELERELEADDHEAEFVARRHAEVSAGAEGYYRALLRGGRDAWNNRDVHMADTLDRLMVQHGPDARAVVWEHNTHIGDARAAGMAYAGLVNVGQLARERHAPEGVVLVGFGSYEGTVAAAEVWGGRARVMRVPPARRGSVEELLHRAALPGGSGLFVFEDHGVGGHGWPWEERDHRAIGVVYRPEHEAWRNYVPTVLGGRYDAFLFLDRTTALVPLVPLAARPDPPSTGIGIGIGIGEEETWPSGV